MRSLLEKIGKPVAGLLLCVALALAVSLFAVAQPWRAVVPLAFAVIIILLALRYGLLVSLLGSVSAAVIFACLLYQPIGSIRVASHSEKSALGWMLLGSIVLSYLLVPAAHTRRRNRPGGPEEGPH